MRLSNIALAVSAQYGGLFKPSSLFTTGVNGAWYDPSDLSTLYQNAAGTTPVTAMEQPVGLMLDKSKGLVLGSELVTNGDFSTDTWWSKDAGWTIGGVASFSNTSAGNLYRANLLTIGKTYKIEFDLTVTAQYVAFLSGNLSPQTAFNTSGHKAVYLTATSTTFSLYAAANAIVSIDNISVRELPGNHAFNSSGNSANFPVLSARYNLLTKTEDFSDAVWSKSNQIATNTAIAPDGLQTADTFDVAVNGSSIYATTSCIPNTSYTFSFFVRLDTLSVSEFKFAVRDDTAGVFIATDVVPSIQLSSTSWAQVKYTFTTPTGCLLVRPYVFRNTTITTGKFYIWGADLRVSNDALNQPAYQRVNTASDYDAVGFKPYLSFNGVNQWLQTNSIDFTYGDKVFVSAGVRKLVDQIGMVAELSSSYDSISGSFGLTARSGSGNDIGWASRGTTLVPITFSVLAPVTAVVSGTGNISAPSATLRVNGSNAAQSTATQGTGNYGNYPLYIGARGGTSLWFNGRLYGLVVAGKQASASEIANTESWMNQKTGAY